MTAKRILVIKHGALGDMIQGLDSFHSLRHGHPDAHIALLTAPAFAGFAQLMPWFDEVVVDPRASFLNVVATWRVRSVIRQNWDMIVDQQCSGRTNRYHAAFARAGVDWFGTAKRATHPYPDFTGVNNHQRMMIAAKMAGGIDSTLTDNPMDWLDNGTATIPAEMPDRAVVLVPGCSPAKPQKRWHYERFAALAAHLKASGHHVVIVGTNAERETVNQLLEHAPFCIDLVGKTNLVELAAIFPRATLVVGNDTGPVFLAARAGAPTIMVMGDDTDPSMSAPTGVNCGWVRKPHIDEVRPEDVMAAFEELSSN